MSIDSTRQVADALAADVSAERLQEHLNVFATLFRDSGTADERRAAEYIRDRMAEYGVRTEILEFDSLISWPREGTLAVLDGQGNEAEQVAARTRSFGASTPEGGVDAELVFVPFEQPEAGAMIFSHRAVAGDYRGLDVRGKIVLTMDGGPDGIRRAEERGAAGHIHIWPSDEAVIHEMIGASVWGTPTPESARRLPSIPVLGVGNADGMRLAGQCQSGTMRVRMTSNVHTAWMRLPLVVADVAPGAGDADGRFLLVGAHIDSWYEGVTDNATGDAALIEAARVLQAHRDGLRYGVRFGWWPGHSTGRYSGSTWYADTRFAELRERCLGYLNIDSPGVRETEIFDCRYNMAEVEHITRDVVERLSGQQPNIRRPLKAGDQSFLGVGLPSLGAFRMLPTDHPDRKAVGGSGGAYWWHSPEDTLDKADADILADDARIYVSMTAALCVPERHPYDLRASANDFLAHLGELQKVAGQHLDLTAALNAAGRYRDAAERLVAAADSVESAAYNDAVVRVTRIVNPALFTIDGPYEVDPALQMPVLPGLAPLRELATMDPESDEYRFLRTALVRQQNRVEDALVAAVRE
ncbi:MAG TPA: M28 family peptidase, partial [Thermomicrobiales bacterium]|nr:M28 family peptidase [Thermomicrobiales bacterium]